jgi:hypothetical protein
MKTGTGEQLQHHENIELVRHVELNSPLYIAFNLYEFRKQYTVGQFPWTTFPVLHDEEEWISTITLIDYHYVETDASMPWAAK